MCFERIRHPIRILRKRGPISHKALRILFELVKKYARFHKDQSIKPWEDIKALLKTLGLRVVGEWKNNRFTGSIDNLVSDYDEFGKVLPIHFINQLTRIPARDLCNIQRILQIAFNLGRAKLNFTLDYFVKLF